MPLPIIHLTIAHQIRNMLNIASSPQFYLGTLAPDAIHMRTGWTRDEKRALHLTTCGKDLHTRTQTAFDFYHTHRNQDNADLLKGYVVHVLVDNFWSHLFARHFHRIYSQQMDKDVAIRQYYTETKTIDAHIFQTNAYTKEICHDVQEAAAVNVLHLLRKTETQAWKQHVLETLRDYPSLPDKPLCYFSLDMIHEYLHICALEIPRLFSDVMTTIAPVLTRYQEHELALKYCKNMSMIFRQTKEYNSIQQNIIEVKRV